MIKDTPEARKRFSDEFVATDSIGAAIAAITPPLDVVAASRPFLLAMLDDRRPTRRYVAAEALLDDPDPDVHAALLDHADHETCKSVKTLIRDHFHPRT